MKNDSLQSPLRHFLSYVFTLVLLIATPLYAEVPHPGNDLNPQPDWSYDFTQGMMAMQQQDYDGAMAHFVACVTHAPSNKPDANCEYYLAIMYLSKNDHDNYIKYLKLAAQHGNPLASTTLQLMTFY